MRGVTPGVSVSSRRFLVPVSGSQSEVSGYGGYYAATEPQGKRKCQIVAPVLF